MIKHSWVRLAIVIFLISIAACSTVKRKDGPPRFAVDETKIADPIPRYEPKSKYGNMPVYRVFGRQYHVMPAVTQYRERGVASWYGSKFHAQRTSSGEPYNMLGMTAAHKTLPLPTYVQVTNLKNGKHVIVKVNDRGPFEGNRLIDLSYVAAKKLGMLGKGTAYVEVQAINTLARARPNSYVASNQPSSSQKIIAPSNSVFVQVGAFRDPILAKQLQQQVSNLLHSPVHISQSQNYYRVKVGPFLNRDEALKVNRLLRNRGILTAHLETNHNHTRYA